MLLLPPKPVQDWHDDPSVHHSPGKLLSLLSVRAGHQTQSQTIPSHQRISRYYTVSHCERWSLDYRATRIRGRHDYTHFCRRTRHFDNTGLLDCVDQHQETSNRPTSRVDDESVGIRMFCPEDTRALRINVLIICIVRLYHHS